MSKGFNSIAQSHWEAGRQLKAIECVIDTLNSYETAHKPKSLLMQLTYYLFLINDYKAASQTLKEAIKYYPDDLDIKVNLIVSLSRSKEFAEAIDIAKTITEQDDLQFIIWDVLANCYAKTQQFELATIAGNNALRIKDELYSMPTKDWRLPKQSIDSFISNKKNVIAFSLWGTQDRYINGAIRNLLLKHDFYPQWEIWIYIDDSVPKAAQTLLSQLGAILQKQASSQSIQKKLCWRFQVANHSDIGRFLVRDIDSVFSVRERLAVEEWQQSNQWFHTINDWWTHTDLMLAGLWGGVSNVLPNVWKMAESYEPTSLTTPNVDQWFLRDCVWSYVKQDCLMHDRFYRQACTRPIPGPLPIGNQHIGSCEFSQMSEQQRKLIAPWLSQLQQ